MNYENFLKSLSSSNLKAIVKKHNDKLNVKLTNSKKETLIKFLLDHTEMKDNKINLKPNLMIKDIEFEKKLLNIDDEKEREKNYLEDKRGDKRERKVARELGRVRAQIENTKDEIGELQYIDYDNIKKESGLKMDKRKETDKKKIKEIEMKLKDLQNKKNETVKKLKDTMKENEDRKKGRKKRLTLM